MGGGRRRRGGGGSKGGQAWDRGSWEVAQQGYGTAPTALAALAGSKNTTQAPVGIAAGGPVGQPGLRQRALTWLTSTMAALPLASTCVRWLLSAALPRAALILLCRPLEAAGCWSFPLHETPAAPLLPPICAACPASAASCCARPSAAPPPASSNWLCGAPKKLKSSRFASVMSATSSGGGSAAPKAPARAAGLGRTSPPRMVDSSC